MASFDNCTVCICGKELKARIINSYSNKNDTIEKYLVDIHGDFEIDGVIFTGRTTIIVPTSKVKESK